MKKILLGILIGFVLSVSLVVLAAGILAKDISFTPNDLNWDVDNLEDAVNDLYTESQKRIVGVGEVYSVNKYSDTRNSYTSHLTLPKGTYICTSSYSNSTYNANRQSSFENSSGRIVIENCDTQSELKSNYKYQSAKSTSASGIYLALYLYYNSFVCTVNQEKNITFTYGFDDNASHTPIGFESSCVKLDIE